LLREIKPRYFIYENVRNITGNKKQWEAIFNEFVKSGYTIRAEILNSMDYGIPQSRQRLYLVGFKDKSEGEQFNFPRKQELLFTMQDFLDKEYDEKYVLSDKKYQHVTNDTNYHSGGITDSKIAKTIMTRNDGYRHKNECNYITVGEKKLRCLTPRECLRLMGFSEDFKIVVSDRQIYKQIGNSIVVNVLKALISSILNNGE